MHSIGHVEIPSLDLKKSKKFFGKVFGWTFTDVPEMDYVTFKAGAPPHGGFYRVKKMPKKGQVNVYIEVEDLEAKLKEIKKAKGKVIAKRTPIGDIGWIGRFATPDGCSLCLWQEAPKPAASTEPNVPPSADLPA
jgi:uncharacterized protein